MFQLTELKEYWCIVTINATRDDFRIVRESDDLKTDGLDTENWDFDYSDVMWDGRHDWQPGLYKLSLEAVYAEAEEDEEIREFCHLQVIAVELLHEI